MNIGTITAGVFGKSLKENEYRLPIHPEHIERIPESLRKRMRFEVGYGQNFGVSDEVISRLTGGCYSRQELFEGCNLLILPKPLEADLIAAQPGTTICGWLHCVQQRGITQAAIDRKLTLITWESMNVAHRANERPVHVFHRNNEIAGYCAVLHAFQIIGVTGAYGQPKDAVIISLGSVSRGAIVALQAMGVQKITVLTRRVPELIPDKIVGCDYWQLIEEGGVLFCRKGAHQKSTLSQLLIGADIIVNGILQDPTNPLLFLSESDLARLKPGSLIIDISCDEGMGFPYARPTSFEKPTFRVGPATYYAVDHTPSYLWNTTTWEISASFLPWLSDIMAGPDKWESNKTISDAIEIRSGKIINTKILQFQKRERLYPHNLIIKV